MKNLIFTLCTLLFMLACATSDGNSDDGGFASNSSVYVDPTLQSNMILQQNATFVITGRGTSSEKIRVTCSWENRSNVHDVVVAPDGKWSVAIKTPIATTVPQTINVRGRVNNPFVNILIGEIWLCAGQSNMQFFLSSSQNGSEHVSRSENPNIRILNMARETACAPTDNFTAKWQPCTPSTIGTFSAAGYFFGQKLEAELNIPIGLIGANWGNTAIEVWTNRRLIEADQQMLDDTKLRNSVHDDGSPHIIGSAYNAMIYPLRNMPIAGVIWYQGENNQGSPYVYSKILKTMVSSWRSDWRSDFAFYIAQICPYKRMWNFETNYSNPAMRFMQATTSEKISNSGFETNDDIADSDDIHPINKKDVGLRLAYLALGNVYSKSNFEGLRSPMLESYTINSNKVIVKFKYATDGLKTSDNQPASMFEICGQDRVFHPATATISGSTVELTSASVPTPIAARLGWSYTKVTNLRSNNSLPVSVFKTYDWSDPQEER